MIFQISIDTGPLAVREALDKIFDALAQCSLEMEEKATIELVLAEVLNNVVEHAYPEPDATGKIDVSAEILSSGLAFEIKDYGHPMPDGLAPLGKQADLDVDFDDLPEGGFGWFLIRDLAKDVIYQRVNDTNVLSLRLAIKRDSQTNPVT